MKALVIDAETWPDDANANLRCLKRDVGQLMNESIGYEKIMWERIEMELNNINVKILDLIIQYVREFSISNQNLS